MLNVELDTYKNAVADAILKARDKLKDHHDTLTDHEVELADHDTTLDNHAANLSNLDLMVSQFKFNPAAVYCPDANQHYIWVTGTDRRLWRKAYAAGAWQGWILTAHAGDWWESGPAVYYISPNIHIYIVGSQARVYHGWYNINSGALSGWENQSGTVGPP